MKSESGFRVAMASQPFQFELQLSWNHGRTWKSLNCTGKAEWWSLSVSYLLKISARFAKISSIAWSGFPTHPTVTGRWLTTVTWSKKLWSKLQKSRFGAATASSLPPPALDRRQCLQKCLQKVQESVTQSCNTAAEILVRFPDPPYGQSPNQTAGAFL